MALRRSGSGKPDTSSLHRIGSSCQDEDGAITAIDGWRRGSPGSVKVAHLLAATDKRVQAELQELKRQAYMVYQFIEHTNLPLQL